MRYVIMADGKGSRWNNFMGHKKHDISVSGETLLERTVRLVHKFDDAAEVIITSHDKSISIPGAVRYEPKNNVLEIDRFTAELIGSDMCFLYGDVLYSERLSYRTAARSRCCFSAAKRASAPSSSATGSFSARFPSRCAAAFLRAK